MCKVLLDGYVSVLFSCLSRQLNLNILKTIFVFSVSFKIKLFLMKAWSWITKIKLIKNVNDNTVNIGMLHIFRFKNFNAKQSCEWESQSFSVWKTNRADNVGKTERSTNFTKHKSLWRKELWSGDQFWLVILFVNYLQAFRDENGLDEAKGLVTRFLMSCFRSHVMFSLYSTITVDTGWTEGIGQPQCRTGSYFSLQAIPQYIIQLQGQTRLQILVSGTT